MQPDLVLRASSLMLIVLLGVILIALPLVSMWKENVSAGPLRRIIRIWFTVAVVTLETAHMVLV